MWFTFYWFADKTQVFFSKINSRPFIVFCDFPRSKIDVVAYHEILLEVPSYIKYSRYVLNPECLLCQGIAYFPTGVRISCTGRAATYERAVAWKVESDTLQCIAYMFIKWSF